MLGSMEQQFAWDAWQACSKHQDALIAAAIQMCADKIDAVETSRHGYLKYDQAEAIRSLTPADAKVALDELDELCKDAERYRWLREQNWYESSVAVVTNPQNNAFIGASCLSREILDEYIDSKKDKNGSI